MSLTTYHVSTNRNYEIERDSSSLPCRIPNLNTPKVAKSHLENYKGFSQMAVIDNPIKTPLSS